MASKFDRSIFIVKFKEETDERLVNLNKGLLALESNPDDQEILNEIFREAHTLKGSAKMVGLSSINQIAHKMEDILGNIKEKKLKMRRDVTDIMLECVSHINELLNAAIKREEPMVDVADVCERLGKILEGKILPVKEINTEYLSEESQEQETIQEKEEKEDKKKEEKIEVVINKIIPAKETLAKEAALHVKDPSSKEPITIEETIRVGIGRLDELMGFIGEMLINRAGMRKIFYEVKEIEDICRSVEFSIEEAKNKSLDDGSINSLEKIEVAYQEMRKKIKKILLRHDELTSHLEVITNDLEYMAIKMRMLPVSTLFDFFPLVIRDLARETGKDVEIELKGQDTGLDKKILEEIKEPLIHIIRNCIDHGIEDLHTRLAAGKPAKGKIVLSASQEGNYVNIVVTDDGAGIDAERVKLIAIKKKLISPAEAEELSDKEIIYLLFTPGFSTKTNITDISGRGVGMDIVKDHIENLKGTVNIETEKGKGSKVILTMPLTLATTQAIILKSGQEIIAIPAAGIEAIVKVLSSDVKMVGEREVIVLKRKLIPVLRLSAMLGLKTDLITIKEDSKIIVIINLSEQRVGFLVDALISQEEIVVKGLGEYLQGTRHVAGATILGGGDVAIILNPMDLIASSKGFTFAATANRKEIEHINNQYTILVVDDSYATRELEKNILESCGYEIETAVDGTDALEKIQKRKFDMVITDVNMPKMDGFELTATLKKHETYQHIPVIILTSLGKEEEKKRGVDVGANAYLVKTAFDQDVLLDTIGRLIG